MNLRTFSQIEKDGVTWDKINSIDFHYVSDIGKPNLPYKIIKLIVPAGNSVYNIQINKESFHLAEASFRIFPTQPLIPTAIDNFIPKFTQPDPEIYNSESIYPEKAVTLINEGYFDSGNHIVILAVYPFQYYPLSGEVVFNSEISFSLYFEPSTHKIEIPFQRTRKGQMIYDEVIRRLVDNTEDIEIYSHRPLQLKNSLSKQLTVPTFEYIIVTDSTLEDAFKPFISWKRRKGYEIGLVTVDKILNDYTNGDLTSGINDDAGNIREYLNDAYSGGTVWCLLAGDYSLVPIRYGCGYSSYDDWDDYYGTDTYKIPADLYFADFTGDWDVDSDVYYGQGSDDNPDYNPEIFVGRLLCADTTDVKNWIAKLLKYEINPGDNSSSYLDKSFMMQSDQMQQGAEANSVAAHLPVSFTHTIWGESPSANGPLPTSPTARSVIAELNNHYGLISWFGHGEPNHIVTMSDSFNTSPRHCINTTESTENYEQSETADGLDSLRNYLHPSILYSISCNNCPFDDFKIADYPGRNLGEGFTVNTYGGGPAFLGNTRYGWVSYSGELYEEFADLITTSDSSDGESCLHLGVAELVSKQNYSYHYLSYSHNLLGCPETMLWTDTLSLFTNVSISDNGTSIAVNANVADCNICVSSGNDGSSYHGIEIGTSSHTFNTSVRPLYITITKHNYKPYTALTGGTFTSNEIWFEDLFVRGDVTISSGDTLTIMPGAEIEFADSDDQSSGNSSSKAELIINGTLKAEDATFTAENSRDWYGIRFTSTASSCRLTGCTIENGDYNLRISGSSPLIEECTFDGGLYAILVETSGADPTIHKCDIKNVSYGIRLQTNTSGDYYDNKISVSTRGIYIYNGDGNFYSNSINYSGAYGVVVSGSSANPNLTGDYTGTKRGNYFDSYMGNDVISISSGSPILGYGTPSGACGYNLFEGVPSGHYYIDNNTGSSLKAEYNYWEDGSSPSVSEFDGTIDFTPWRTTTPAAGTTWKKTVTASPFAEIIAAYHKNDYEKVIRLAPEALENYIFASLAQPVLNRYFASLKKQNKLTLDEIETKLTPDYPEEIQQIARGWLVRYYAENKQIDKAEKTALSVGKKSLFARSLLLDVLYFNALQDNEVAIDRIKNILTDNHKDETISEDIQAAIDAAREDNIALNNQLPKQKQTESAVVPQKLTVMNYPNPFNSITKIQFNLPKNGHVKITIYNMRGQLVRSLADDNFEAGRHFVTWNGRNAFEMPVATGVYFYRVQFKDHVLHKKLLLLQ